MKKLVIVILMAAAIMLMAFAVGNAGLVKPPEPVFVPSNFLLLPGIEQFTLDYALAWTDSAAGLYSKQWP